MSSPLGSLGASSRYDSFIISDQTAGELAKMNDLSMRWIRIKDNGEIKVDGFFTFLKNTLFRKDQYASKNLEETLFTKAKEWKTAQVALPTLQGSEKEAFIKGP